MSTIFPGYPGPLVGVGLNVDPRSELVYKDFEKKLPPPVPDGPEPTSGKGALTTDIHHAARFLPALSTPRRQADRTVGDEFALLVEQYNKQHGYNYPIDLNDPWWTKQGADPWLLQNIFGRIATGRVNAYQSFVKCGRGNCTEGFFESIGNAISKIPIVGDVVHIVGEAAVAPFNLVSSIASGARLDHALLGALKDQVKIVKDVAPYAQMVVSFVPGIGTGVAAAIGAGAALVEGKSIDEALKAGIKGALPGGPIAAAAFDTAMKAMSGENIGKAALEGARNLVPDGPARKAFDIGVAVATGEKLQNALVKGLVSIAPGQLQTILATGEKAIASTPGLSDALKFVPVGEAQKGFRMAAGLLGQANMNEKALAAVRNQLSAAVRQGFDAALNSQAKHIPWIENVTHASVTASAPTQAQLDLQALSKLTPAQQKQLVDLQALSKLTPEQQKQLVDYAKAKNAPAAIKTPKPHEPPAKKAPMSVPAVVTRAAAPAAAQAASAPGAPSGAYGPYPTKTGALHGLPGYALGDTATEVRSPTSTSTEVRSPTSTSTEVRSPTSTSTEAYTQGNFTVTVTGGAGAGSTSVDIHAPPLNRANTAQSKGPRMNAQENTSVHAPRPGTPTAQENSSVNAPRSGALHGAPRYGAYPSRLGALSGPPPSCRALGAPIHVMAPGMRHAGLSAVHGSGGRSRMVRSPDGTDYLFMIENGTLTARECFS